MSLRPGTLRDVLALTRPQQWPILSGQFLVSVLLVSPGAVGGGCWLNTGSALVLAGAWLAWVVLLNGFTLAYNSSQDRDSGPVAYLPDPPDPPAGLAAFSIAAMLLGAALGAWVVGPAFGAVTLACVALSILYSVRGVRAKSIPGVDLLINMVGYGAATTLAGVLAGRAAHLMGGVAGDAVPNPELALRSACGTSRLFLPQLPGGDGLADPGALAAAVAAGGIGWIILAFGLLFGSLYPLTQIYQAEEDAERGDRTLAGALGAGRSLNLAIGLGVMAAAAFARAMDAHGGGWRTALPLAALALWVGHLVIWRISLPTRTAADHERGMYRALNLWAVVDVALVLAWIL